MMVCPRCHLPVLDGEELNLSDPPQHVQCKVHGGCIVLCVESHPDLLAIYRALRLPPTKNRA